MAFKFRKEIHPLFNSTILQRIFEPLQVHTLKRVRLVCKTWNYEASSFLQSKSQVVLIRGKELDKKHLSYKNFLDYIQTLPSQEEIFFQNYHIEHWILNAKREKSLNIFWSICGPRMKKLYLKDIIFYEIETIENVFFFNTPYLESLTIVDCLFYTITQENLPAVYEGRSTSQSESDEEESYIFFDYYDHIRVEQLSRIDDEIDVVVNKNLKRLIYEELGGEVFPLSWEKVFQAYPNLKDLRIAACTPEDQISELLSTNSKTHENYFTPISKIENISFYKSESKESSFLSEEHLQLLSSIYFNTLSSIEIILNDSIQLNHLIILLRNNSKSLKKILLYRPPCDSIPIRPQLDTLIPVNSHENFTSLKNLQISMNLIETLNNFSQNLSKMNSLQTLSLWDGLDSYNWEDKIVLEFNPSVKPCQSIKKFSCGYFIKNVESFHNLSSILCNLIALEASLNDEQIRIVFQNMKNLEEITVLDRHLTDSGITGNPILLSDTTEWSPTIQREYPYIGDLKRLKRFVLKYWKYDQISDTSIYHGFLDVNNLSHLHLTNTKISNTALDILCNKSSLITLLKSVDMNTNLSVAIKGEK